MAEGERLPLTKTNMPYSVKAAQAESSQFKASRTAPKNQPCPQCGNSRTYKNGMRYTTQGQVQRLLCRTCGFRFSQSLPEPNQEVKVSRKIHSFKPSPDLAESRVCEADSVGKEVFDNGSFTFGKDVRAHNITNLGKGLYVLSSCSSSAECAPKKAKNLTVTQLENVAGEINQQEAKGLLLQYTLYLQKEGYGENCRYVSCIRMLINSGCNLYDPEDVKASIAKKKWKNGTKMQASYAYDAMTRMLKLSWTMPRYVQEEILPFIPEEKELDELIAASRSQRMTSYLQTLKETMADPTEALRLRWIDINGNIISINGPVKGHRPRQLEVSSRLIAMLNSLPKTSELIFPTNYRSMQSTFVKVRKRVAYKLQNPRLLKISFVTFRHWGATMVYHYSRGGLLLVQKLLGHKRITSTMKYTQLIQFKDDEYDVATATTIEEAKTIVAAGYDFVTEKQGIMLFKRPKRFGSMTLSR